MQDLVLCVHVYNTILCLGIGQLKTQKNNAFQLVLWEPTDVSNVTIPAKPDEILLET